MLSRVSSGRSRAFYSARIHRGRRPYYCFRSRATSSSSSSASSTASTDNDSSETASSSRLEDIDYTKLPRLYVGTLNEAPRLIRPTDSLTAALNHPIPSFSSSTVSPSRSTALLAPKAILPLSTDQSHHVRSVLRLPKKGSSQTLLRLFDGGSNQEWLAELVSADSNSNNGSGDGKKRKRRPSATDPVIVQCLQPLPTRTHTATTTNTPVPAAPAVSNHCWLCLAPPKKKERVRWMLEKTTELNAAGWVFLETDRSQAAEGASWDKWQAYVIAAAQQCERGILPQFVTLVDDDNNVNNNNNDEAALLRTQLSTLLQMWSNEQQDATATATTTASNNNNHTSKGSIKLLVCRERRSSVSVWRALEEIYTTCTSTNDSKDNEHDGAIAVCFLIGPEGGWSPAEEAALDKLEVQYPCCLFNVGLGPTVLRAETAAMTAAAAYTLFHDHHQHHHGPATTSY